MQILEYAKGYNQYLAALFEQGIKVPLPTSDLPFYVKIAVGAAVCHGRHAAEAMNIGNTAIFDHYRSQFNGVCNNFESGKEYGQLDLCWQVGYNSVRKDG